MKNSDSPLECKIEDNKLVISIGIDTLAFAAETSDRCGKYDKYSCPDGVWTRVSNKKEFAKEILSKLQREEEDGTTPVHTLLDDAINRAIDDGAQGIKFRGKL